MRPTQTRTNHLGYDAGSSRRIPGGLTTLACAATTESLESGNPNVLTLLSRRSASSASCSAR